MSDLNKITARFGRAYYRNKRAKDWLDKSQKALFKAFDEDLSTRVLSQQIVDWPQDWTIADLLNHYPGWSFVMSNEDGSALLQQDPTLASHTYVNPDTKMVFGRDQVNGAPSLDNDRLQEDDPDLWERISEWPEPWYHIIRSTCEYWTRDTLVRWSQDSIDSVVNKLIRDFNVQRVLKDLNKVSDNDLVLLQEYIIPGKVSVRLRPPRPAKPEDLDVS